MLPPKPPTKQRRQEEYTEQTKLVLEIRNNLAPKYPHLLRWLYSTPNGAKLDHATRTKVINEGGNKAGVPDLFLPVNNGRYVGLYIEMKSKTGVLSSKQKEFKEFVESQGYKVIVPRSYEEALRGVLEYCGIVL